ncbi:hypothetical protein TGAM01_v203537 [Trichoderma gamsii]|uniref:NmrA-like domain-containing protein n=1 Tax=Trichoderma gamsii TaxID=398673 RepID=A0A2P4ZTZ2_9HYPO|nr:hypothetical protein TGAM01_v203537 [Trichoderma gamsii]PON27770.1 hypothetical protein TGAM01_v203537 [Trichoderma gamsii]
MSSMKVAVVGASGNLGVYVVQALLRGGFGVTAITRNESTATFPQGVAVMRVDFSSLESIRNAVVGQDAVVSLTASAGTATQRTLIDAIIEARVPRFIPSEFGLNNRKYRDSRVGHFLREKVSNSDYLIELSERHEWFSWTGLSTEVWLDYALENGIFILNARKHEAMLLDSGNETFSASSLDFVSKAILEVLRRSDKTANKYLSIAEVTTTQSEVINLAEDICGIRFDRSQRSSKELSTILDERLAKGDKSAYIGLLELHFFADGAGHALKDEDNASDLLGLQPRSLRDILERALAFFGRG